MEIKPRIVFAVVLAVLSGAILVACGGGDGTGGDGTGGDGTTGGTVAESAGSTEGTDGTGEDTESTPESGKKREPQGEGKKPSGEAEPSGEAGAPESESQTQQGRESEAGGGKQQEGGSKNSEESPPSRQKGIRGFGGEANAAETEAASRVVIGYLNAIRQEDWSAACAALSKSVLNSIEKVAASNPQFEGKSCVALFGAAAKANAKPKLGKPTNGPIDALRVKGKKGYALYNGESLAMQVLKEAGGWKLNAIEPVKLS